MDRKELAYMKQTLFIVKDWDAFQAVLRTWAILAKYSSSTASTTEVKRI